MILPIEPIHINIVYTVNIPSQDKTMDKNKDVNYIITCVDINEQIDEYRNLTIRLKYYDSMNVECVNHPLPIFIKTPLSAHLSVDHQVGIILVEHNIYLRQ